MVISQRPLSYLSLKAMMTKRKTISLTLILMIFDRLMIVDYSLLQPLQSLFSLIIIGLKLSEVKVYSG